MNKQNPTLLLITGIIVLGIGFAISFLFPEMGQEEKVALMRQAGQTGGAQAAAEAVSSINQKELMSHIVSMLCYGMGAAFTGIGGLAFLKKQPKRKN
ncbi:MAG: hypothetical protein KBA38_05715 [Negativicutes bacterium]|jgi:hypothetical protein|nr:hypothetical protein [Negativicutes bacterium]